MKEYLVDVPVKINIWVRPDCQKLQWDIIKKARPSILFIQSDGGRNEKEWNAILQNRKMIDSSIDWNCKVYRFYEDHNNGLFTMGEKVSKFIWSKVDRCIFTEDDQIMSVSFFQFCAELLEKYKDDTRIECICGMNHVGISADVSSDYFFSKQGSIWGVATWKRVIEERGDFSYYNDKYIMRLLKDQTKDNKNIYKSILNYPVNETFNGHVPSGEFWIEFDMYSQNRLQIIPKVNLISNIGTGIDSEHSNSVQYLPKAYKRIYSVATYEMAFPMKHPMYVIPDTKYERDRNRIMAYNHPIITFYRKLIQVLKMIMKGDFASIRRKMRNRKRKEK